MAACTALDTPVVPRFPSSSATSPVTAAIAANHPPELSPAMPMRSGLRLYLPAFARSHRMAALMSCSCPGNLVCPLLRIATPATAYPALFNSAASAGPPCRPLFAIHADPLLKITTGIGPVDVVGM